MGDAGLEVAELRVRRGAAEVLRGVDLTVARGEYLVVLGPSGAGKSTLLRAVAGLEPVTAGRVSIAGRDVTTMRPGQRQVSMVFQSYALFPHLSVERNIGFPLMVNRVPPEQVQHRVLRAAQACGCAHLLRRLPGQLSGGEQQRVALARALVREPDVYLLDEPLSNLDLELRVATRGELMALHERVGGTVVHVTHDQTEALVLGHRIAVMRDGRVEQVGTPEQIWRDPQTTFVARFVGSPAMNVMDAAGLWGYLAGADLRVAQVGVRPEAVRLRPVDGDDHARGYGLGPDGTVRRVDVIGDEAHVYVQVGEQLVVSRSPAAGRPATGATVRLDVLTSDVHRFDSAGRRVG